ncbi:MAG: hypothetical protein ACKOEE_04670 [Tagaea sp.]
MQSTIAAATVATFAFRIAIPEIDRTEAVSFPVLRERSMRSQPPIRPSVDRLDGETSYS